MMEIPPKLATPPAAFTVVVPFSVPPPGFVANETVTGPLNVVATFSAESSALITIDGERFAPATALPGRVVNERCVGVPAVAVAENVAGEPTSPETEAVTVWTPAAPPSVHVFVATPEALVRDDVAPSEPAPLATVQLTATPPTGLPEASVTDTLSGFESARVARFV